MSLKEKLKKSLTGGGIIYIRLRVHGDGDKHDIWSLFQTLPAVSLFTFPQREVIATLEAIEREYTIAKAEAVSTHTSEKYLLTWQVPLRRIHDGTRVLLKR